MYYIAIRYLLLYITIVSFPGLASSLGTSTLVQSSEWARVNSETVASPGSVRDILPPEGATSAVWQYFGFAAKEGKFNEADKKRFSRSLPDL